jgi:hypothetical protein
MGRPYIRDMRRGAALGFVVLLVALVVTLLLVARSWQSLAPTAIEVSRPGAPDVNVRVNDHGESEAAEALRRGNMPDLKDARKATDARSEEIQRALSEVE